METMGHPLLRPGAREEACICGSVRLQGAVSFVQMEGLITREIGVQTAEVAVWPSSSLLEARTSRGSPEAFRHSEEMTMAAALPALPDRKSTRLNSSHRCIS